MQKFFINGGKRLYGKIKVDCAKNAILPIMAGAILVNGEVILENVPPYSDVLNMIEILKNLISREYLKVTFRHFSSITYMSLKIICHKIS